MGCSGVALLLLLLLLLLPPASVDRKRVLQTEYYRPETVQSVLCVPAGGDGCCPSASISGASPPARVRIMSRRDGAVERANNHFGWSSSIVRKARSKGTNESSC